MLSCCFVSSTLNLICPCRTASTRKCGAFLALNSLQPSRKIICIRRQVVSPRSKDRKRWLEKGSRRSGENCGGEDVRTLRHTCWIPEAFRKIQKIIANAFFSILILANSADFLFGFLCFVKPVLKKLFLLCYIERIKPKWACNTLLESICCTNTRYCSVLICDTCVRSVLKNSLHLYAFIK